MSSWTPVVPRPPAQEGPRSYRIGRAIFMIAAYAMVALMLVMFVSGLLAGGQFGPTDDIKWDVALPWPAVPIPDWLIIGICVLPPIAAVLIAIGARAQHIAEFAYFIAVTLLLFVLFPFGFSRLYPNETGPPFDDRHDELGLADHWFGATFQIVTLAVLVIRLITLLVAQRRSARAESTREATAS